LALRPKYQEEKIGPFFMHFPEMKIFSSSHNAALLRIKFIQRKNFSLGDDASEGEGWGRDGKRNGKGTRRALRK